MTAMTRRRLCLNLALLFFLCLLLPARAASPTYLVVDGVEYSASINHVGAGWSYTYSSGMGYLRLNNYTGGAITIPCSAAVEFEGLNLISATDGQNALYCAGEVLSVGSTDPDAELTLMGGAGAPVIYGSSVSLWGWGKLYALATPGSAAVWGSRAVLVTMEQMVLSGNGQMAITTEWNGIIRVSGAHKYYAGMTPETAVESVFYGGEFYLRAEPARADITFDASGGTVNGGEQYAVSLTVTTSGTNLILYTPVREGYTFMGWNSEPDGSGESPPPRLFSGGELVYYAQWQQDPIAIPEDMMAFESAVIYLAIYRADGQLWQITEVDRELAAVDPPELPEVGMTYALYCVEPDRFLPLTPPKHGRL